MKRSHLRRGEGSARKQRLKKTIFDEGLERGFLTESDIFKIKLGLSHGRMKSEDVFMPEGGWKITPEQSQKGLAFLMKQWKGKSGVPSKNSPFGYREEAVLENFKEFRLIDFYDTATAAANAVGIHYYQPVYRVMAKDGSSFEYVMDYRAAPKTGVYIIG